MGPTRKKRKTKQLLTNQGLRQQGSNTHTSHQQFTRQPPNYKLPQ